MAQIEHNGPQFHYRVYWQKDIPTDNFEHVDIKNWTQNSLMINEQPVFQKYRIKVVALNELGQANVTPNEVIGYSGEDKPTEVPGNFTVIQVTGADSAVLGWNPVSPESVRGHFKGYKIETWTEAEGEQKLREIHVKGEANSALVTKFTPASKNFARILVYNGRYNGPPSNIVSFVTLEGKPGTVYSFEAYPLGSSALWLKWKPPQKTNGVLTGYKIYYQRVNGTGFDLKKDREPHIDDPRINSCKLAGLDSDTKYRIHIRATTKAGEGEEYVDYFKNILFVLFNFIIFFFSYFIEQKTLPLGSYEILKPEFALSKLPSQNGYARLKVQWRPSSDGHSGSHFYAKYRKENSKGWTTTKPEESDDNLEIDGLDPDSNYEVKVVAVDGKSFAESEAQSIYTSGFEGPIIVPDNKNVATAGWFIGMILAIAFLILILCIICIIKRNRGGKYDVHDREVANGRRDFDEGGFHEYSQP